MINKKCTIDYIKNIYQLDDSFNKKSSSLFETKTFLKIFADSNSSYLYHQGNRFRIDIS